MNKLDSTISRSQNLRFGFKLWSLYLVLNLGSLFGASHPDWWYEFGAADTEGTIYDVRVDAVFEAEDALSRTPGVSDSFNVVPMADARQGECLAAEVNDGDNIGQSFADAPKCQYTVNFPAAGQYFVWLRMFAPTGSDDSCHLGINGAVTNESDRVSTGGTYNRWVWRSQTMDQNRPILVAPASGNQTLELIMREDGLCVDTILITRDPDFVPSDVGDLSKAMDFAAANQGQAKNMARAAREAMDKYLPGGAGAAVSSMVDGWSVVTADTSDFSVVNLGQLKTIAKPFYDRLIEEGIAGGLPWHGKVAKDYSMANIGQVKQLFYWTFTGGEGDTSLDLARFWHYDLIQDGSRYALIMDTPNSLGLSWTYQNGGSAWVEDASKIADLRNRAPGAKIFTELRWYSVPDNHLWRIPGHFLGVGGESGPGWSNYYLKYWEGGFGDVAGRVAEQLMALGVDGIMLDWNYAAHNPHSQLGVIQAITDAVHAAGGTVLANINENTYNPAALLCDHWDCEQPLNSYRSDPWNQNNPDYAALANWHGIVRDHADHSVGLDVVRFFVYSADEANWLYSKFANFRGLVKFQFEQFFPNPYQTDSSDALNPKFQYEPVILPGVAPLPR